MMLLFNFLGSQSIHTAAWYCVRTSTSVYIDGGVQTCTFSSAY